MDLSGLTKNPLFGVALKGLKKTISENNIDLITVRLKADGELNIEPYTEKMVVISAADLEQLKIAVYGNLE
jgi:hypothetical protein